MFLSFWRLLDITSFVPSKSSFCVLSGTKGYDVSDGTQQVRLTVGLGNREGFSPVSDFIIIATRK